jgi:hypothetical protein
MQLYNIIRDHPIFTSTKKRHPQVAIQLQLLIFLCKLSSSGTGGKFTRIGKFFRVSKGNAFQCVQCFLMVFYHFVID